MIYLKSVVAGILALVASAMVILTIMIIILVAVVWRYKPDGIDIPRISIDWPSAAKTPFFWLILLLIFGAGFYWEFRRLRH